MHSISNGWTAVLTLALFAAFIIWILPNQAEQAEAISGGAGSPDSSFYYSAAELYAMAEAYGPEGRQAYIRSRFTFDVVWPLAYTLFLGTWISWAFRKLHAADALWQKANLVPIFGGIFDLFENSSASIVMARYPITTPILDSLTAVFTMTKWVFVRGSFIVFLVGLLIGVFFWVYRRKTA